MFEVTTPSASAATRCGLSEFRAWTASLPDVERRLTDAERIDAIQALEELKAAAAAAQARLAVDFAASQEAEQVRQGSRQDKVGLGVGAQIALARRESPHAGGRLRGMAEALTKEMPHAWAAFAQGRLSEWRATLLVRETAYLTVADRRAVDERIAHDPDQLSRMGNRELVAAARRISYELDPKSAVERARRAESERSVSLRPAPDTMTYLTALLPVAQGVAAYAALTRAAGTARATGDERGRGQVMADSLVTRLTGQAEAAGVPVGVQLVMNESTLLGRGHQAAILEGFGPIPAGLARDLVARSPESLTWLRRLFVKPPTHQLVSADSRSRLFPSGLARLIATRDQYCRSPWCGAPIRHVDHPQRHADDGKTSLANGQGLCEACNLAKEAPGWRARPGPGGAGDEVVTTTPTGHDYCSRPPPLPRSAIHPEWIMPRRELTLAT